MKEESCIVMENSIINKNYYILKINAPYIAENAKPGNFVMLKASRGVDPLLKRPFGIFKSEPPFIWLYYEVVGKGTRLIASLRANDRVHILGPLGNSFPEFRNKNILMVAGGRGIAPIYFAIRNYSSSNNVFLIYGARSADGLNLQRELKAFHIKKFFLYTDNGSVGKKGLITTDIIQIISENKIDITFSCGPDAMLKSLAGKIEDMKVENYVSLEALMGCGFGICYSCAVKTIDNEYKKVCTDGPVFKMDEIEW